MQQESKPEEIADLEREVSRLRRSGAGVTHMAYLTHVMAVMDVMDAAITISGVVIRCAVMGSTVIAETPGTPFSRIILDQTVGLRQLN